MKFFDPSFFYRSRQKQLCVTSPNGFHLRPVAAFVNTAKQFSCRIMLSFNHRTVDAKSINAVLSLSLNTQDCFTLITQGRKSQEALEALSTAFSTLMKNDLVVHTVKKEKNTYRGNSLEGEIICEGIAIAPLYTYQTKNVEAISALDFHQAIKESINELNSLYKTYQTRIDGEIFFAQKELLAALAPKHHNFESLESAVNNIILSLKGGTLEAKISDYHDLLERVKKHMGREEKIILPDTPFILLADDLLPGQVEILSKSPVKGVILQETTLRSHTAILLRASGIPSLIVKFSQEEEKTLPGKNMILDTFAGVLIHTPNQQDIQHAKERSQQNEKYKKEARNKRFEKAFTPQGKPIHLLANVSDTASAKEAKEEGAEGIGLLRTEFLFTTDRPALQTQIDTYREIFDLFDLVTVRTLDVGGDKALPYIQLPHETNPFLGIRGVRLFQTHPQILEEQLHAIFIAAKNKPVKIMFPMVAYVQEFTEAKDFAQNVAKKYSLDISNIQFGIMIEVPSVLFMLDRFNDVVDFYSIGTNDLSQYLFAIERTHPTLKSDEDPTALYEALSKITTEATKPVSICGELASDKEALPKLLALGIDTLSVSAKHISLIKEEIRHV
ncbi:MAG: HPr family phosphocarrier protein [Campylobacterales bacterium]|nr:HPr family phosphocarrier protein [Campylobacterales bacterium]